MRSRNRKHPRFNTYDREFKQKVILYAEQQSTREAQRKYGIPESNVRRWRRLKERIFGKDAPVPVPIMKKKDRKKKHSKGAKQREGFEYEIENVMLQEYDYNDSSSLDSVPLNQRISHSNGPGSTHTDQLQSEPLSPTKLKVTRQTSKLQKFAPIAPKPSEVPESNQNEEVCLRWNSHHSNMQTAFPSLLKKEQFVDVTLVADGKMLKCHRVILSSCSTYFEDILESIEYNQHPVIFLKGIPFWILKSLTDFMYVGEVNIDQNKLQELLDVAELLKIKGLAGKSENSQQPVDAKPERDVQKKTEQSHVQPQNIHTQPKLTSKPPQKRSEMATSTGTHVTPAVLPIEQMPITDPLELLEPTYQEETRPEEEPSVSKQRELRTVAKKPINKKVRKRKSPDAEEAQIHFRLRRGTRSRPNVKVPKYYHNDFETQVAAQQQSTVTVDTDPFSQIENIKAEPIEIDDVSLDFNEIGSGEAKQQMSNANESECESEEVLITGLEAERVLVPTMIPEKKVTSSKSVPFTATSFANSLRNNREDDPVTRISIKLNVSKGNKNKAKEDVNAPQKIEKKKRHSEVIEISHTEDEEEKTDDAKIEENQTEESQTSNPDSLQVSTVSEPVTAENSTIDSRDSVVDKANESQGASMDISDTVVQIMDHDNDKSESTHHVEQNLNDLPQENTESLEEEVDTVSSCLPEDADEDELLEGDFVENENQDSISQEVDCSEYPAKDPLTDETPSETIENSCTEQFGSQVENIQITQVMSLNAEENEDSLMDIEENRLLEGSYEDQQEKPVDNDESASVKLSEDNYDHQEKPIEEESATLPITQFDESLLENDLEKA